MANLGTQAPAAPEIDVHEKHAAEWWMDTCGYASIGALAMRLLGLQPGQFEEAKARLTELLTPPDLSNQLHLQEVAEHEREHGNG